MSLRIVGKSKRKNSITSLSSQSEQGDTMEIHNHGKNLKVHYPTQSGANESKVAPELKSANGVDQAEEVKPQRLLERLQGKTEVRERLLVEIQAKIHAGEYSTRAAAEKAAQHIVGL
jgi:hypothetical protein